MSNHLKIKKFFEKNKIKLEEVYPGINIKFLLEIFDDCDNETSTSYFFEKLEAGVPLQYISGRAYFYKSSFMVNENVLIPRSETEILIEMAIEELGKLNPESPITLLDVGTGSGAIILSIMADFTGGLIASASDISTQALEVAKSNYKSLHESISAKSTLEFICTDRLKNIEKKYHMIVSNPPYIKENIDRAMVHNKVVEYEPHVALFLKDIEYDEWFNTFFEQVYNSLLPGGTFIMEGHESHLESLKKLTTNIGFNNVKVIKDYTDRERFIIAKKD